MAIQIPDGVRAVSIGVVGYARVLLRSDALFHCVDCDKTEPATAGGPSTDPAACDHIGDVRRRGVVRYLRDERGRSYPEFVWLRAGGKIVARWPEVDDPDSARETLVVVLKETTDLPFRRLDDESIGKVVDTILVNLSYKGYCVVPEWCSTGPRPKARAKLAGRGARLFDVSDEEVRS